MNLDFLRLGGEHHSGDAVAHSPMEAPLQMADLNASWNSLFAQYQQ